MNGRYTLTHDGPGSHEVRVTGTFRADHKTGSESGACPALPLGPVEVPVAFTTKISVVHLGSVRADPLTGCGDPAVILSGRTSPAARLSLRDDQGNYFYASNVYDSYPLDMVVETEKPAQVAEGPSGIRSSGLIITGEPQKVRLSTSYGTLFTYQLADTSMVDGWDLKFWSRQSQYVKALEYPLPLDSNPAVASAKVLLAQATLQVGGSKVCSPLLASDFKASLLSPAVCNIVLESNPTNLGIPGYLATFVDTAGACELEVSVPGANGGQGLMKHLSTIFVPPPPL